MLAKLLTYTLRCVYKDIQPHSLSSSCGLYGAINSFLRHMVTLWGILCCIFTLAQIFFGTPQNVKYSLWNGILQALPIILPNFYTLCGYYHVIWVDKTSCSCQIAHICNDVCLIWQTKQGSFSSLCGLLAAIYSFKWPKWRFLCCILTLP